MGKFLQIALGVALGVAYMVAFIYLTSTTDALGKNLGEFSIQSCSFILFGAALIPSLAITLIMRHKKNANATVFTRTFFLASVLAMIAVTLFRISWETNPPIFQ